MVTDRYRLWQVLITTADITVRRVAADLGSNCATCAYPRLAATVMNQPGETEVNIVWGLSMAAAGLFMLASGTMKSEFVVYQLLVARSRILWGEGDAVHRFYQVSGLIVMILGVLWATGLIWSG